MVRQDQQYWQRLRKDRRSNFAVLLTVVALVAASVSLTTVVAPGSQYEARINPLYWLILLPVAWWVSSLAAFEPKAVRWWKPVLGIACLVSGGCLVLAFSAKPDVTIDLVSTGATLLATVGALALHRGSLVAEEGPAR